MPVKIEGSYVSEAAAEFAKTRQKEREEAKDTKTKGSVLSELQEKFSGLNITVGTKPFSESGKNNLSISPKILKEMEQDPNKRTEYEALIYDVANTDLAQGRKLKSSGFIIDDKGGLSAWSVSENNGQNQSHVKRSDKKNWWQEILPKKQKKKSSPLKEAREKLSEKTKEAAKVEISQEAKAKLFEEKSTANAFTDANELSKYLFQNFDIVKQGMSKISAKFLRDCVDDEEKRQNLFDNLAAADASLKARQDEVGFQDMRIIIDENGEVTSESTKSTVCFNGEKIKRQMEAAATKGDMQAVLKLIEADIETLTDGLKNNMCDAAEVQKAKDMMTEAKSRMAKLPDRPSTPEEQAIMTLNMLI